MLTADSDPPSLSDDSGHFLEHFTHFKSSQHQRFVIEQKQEVDKITGRVYLKAVVVFEAGW